MQETPSCRFSVAVRVRPKLENPANATQANERYEKLACTSIGETSLRLWDGKPGKDSRSYQFTYDHVFTADASQEEVYENAVVDAVDATLAGTNATIMAYGQTGSGKTYTILGNPARKTTSPASSREGSAASDAEWSVERGEAGVLLRAVLDILNFADRLKARRHVVVGVSVLELYQDEVRDLLRSADVAAPLPISMAKDVVRVPGLTFVPIHKPEDIYDVYARAAAKRVQRATSANDTSSRSHAVFSIEVFQIPTVACPEPPSLSSLLRMREAFLVGSLDQSKPSGSQATANRERLASAGAEARFFEAAANPLMGPSHCPVLHSKLTVADLAGSEKVRQSQVTGAGFDELRRINASLTALGNVVHSLYSTAKHIPYRDSKLTMLLRDAFAAPSAHVVLVANVSPTVLTLDETLSSLFFADKIKAIKTTGNPADRAQQELEASLLATTQVHDALLADVRIFQCEHEQAPGAFLRKAATSASMRKALLDPVLHVATRDKRTNAVAMGNLCEALSAEQRAQPAGAREAAFLKAQCVSLREQYMDRHRRHLGKAAAEMERLEREKQRFHEANKPHWTALEQNLAASKAAYKAAAATRQDATQQQHARASELVAVKQEEARVNAAVTALAAVLQLSAKDTAAHEQFLADAARADADWLAATQLTTRALEVADIRQTMVQAMREAAGTPSSPTVDSRQKGRPRTQTVEEWLRHAVLAMAGNAVVQSMRRGAAAHADPDVVPLRTMTNFNTVGAKPKYWTREMQAHKHARREKHRAGSTFDDPHLLDSIISFMDMGAVLDKRGHDGRTKRRMFYVNQADKEPSLRWEEVRPSMQNFREKGKVALRQITRILLGQTSPTFISYTDDDKAARFFSSFSVEYTDGPVQKRRNSASTATTSTTPPTTTGPENVHYVDILCDNLADMETWVVGLSVLCGLQPTYADTREPTALDDVPEDAAEDVAAASLSAATRRLCADWHIPTAVFAEAQCEINERRTRRRSGMLSLTPGELRGLTRLDIFRASAMWAHFFSYQMICPPGSTVFCTVYAPGLTPVTPLRWRAEKVALTRAGSEEVSSADAATQQQATDLDDDPPTEVARC